jgi:hypothetical protein
MGLRSPKVIKDVSVPATTFHRTATLPFLSSRAKPRDLQFNGLLLVTKNTLLKRNVHLACPGVPWDRSGEICGLPLTPTTVA